MANENSILYIKLPLWDRLKLKVAGKHDARKGLIDSSEAPLVRSSFMSIQKTRAESGMVEKARKLSEALQQAFAEHRKAVAGYEQALADGEDALCQAYAEDARTAVARLKELITTLATDKEAHHHCFEQRAHIYLRAAGFNEIGGYHVEAPEFPDVERLFITDLAAVEKLHEDGFFQRHLGR